MNLKKFISIVIVMTMLLTSVSQGLFVFAESNNERARLEEFGADLTAMIRENSVEAGAGADMFPSFSAPEFSTGVSSDLFETKRLIVKADRLKDYQGAVDCVSGYNDLYILQYNTVSEAKKAYEYYLECDNVQYVEPDVIVETSEDIEVNVPVDIGEMDEIKASAIEWLSDKIGFSGIKDKLVDKIENDYILVAVLDSGVDTDHELLVDRIEDSSANMSDTGEADSIEDDYGHGTHVAGIIASNTLSNVKIRPYKVLNQYGKGSLSTIAHAVDIAVADGADIINMSLSAKLVSERMTEAVNDAVASDVNVVVSAGNSGSDLDLVYYSPACIESAITVSATDKNDNLADFSNYDNTIDICAPGTNIESSYLNNTYASLSGTSMAAPQVTAGLALIQSIYSNKSASECEEMIKEYAIKMFENEGENHFGAGMLYLKYLLDGMPTTTAPVFSVDSCEFSEIFTVEIVCAEPDASIYYLTYDTDLESFSMFDGVRYEEPIRISVDTKIAAIAYTGGKYPSEIVTVEYDRIGSAEEDFYEINSLGYITDYYDSKSEIVVPEVVKNKKVVGIASNAFKGNTKLVSVTLPADVTDINSSAFEGCTSLTYVAGSGVEKIGSYAFRDTALETVDFPKLERIGSYAFAGTTNLGDMTFNNLTEMDMYVFDESGITGFNAPILEKFGTNCFASCYNLEAVSMPLITELPIGTFKNCISLKTVDLPELVSIKANAFRNSAFESFVGEKVTEVGNYAFADNSNLQYVYLPNVTSTGTNIFSDCTSLIIIGLPSLKELNASVFSGCASLINLYLPEVTSVVKNAFKGSSVEMLKFESIEEIKSLPDTLQVILLPETLTLVSTTAPGTDFVVYGYEGSYAEEYAESVNREFRPVPAIYEKTSTQVSADEQYIYVLAIGFDCKYQWYSNETASNTGGTLIEGAIRFYYEPDPDDNCTAYYCVVTSECNGHYGTVVTEPILNAPEYRDADYTEYNALVEEINSLDRTLYDEEYLNDLDELLLTDVSGLKLSQQGQIDELVAQISVALELVKNSFVMGDLNGDKLVSAIDVRFALKQVAGIVELSQSQLVAADRNNDGEITAVDARLIMQKALEL